MNITKKFVLGIGSAWMLSAAAFADVPTGGVVQHVPGQVLYQAVLANPATGETYQDGTYTLDVRVWTSETRKNGCLWGAKYTVAVKDGFFSLMLGDTAAAELEPADGEPPTYAKDEFWKALWGETTEDVDRYVGITPHEDSRCVPVNILTEISPRHRLMSVPFAFRAERAHYADASLGDFAVGGDLTVKGAVSFSGGLNVPNTAKPQSFGPIKTSSTDVQISGVSVPVATSPNIYMVGYLLAFQGYGGLTMGSTQGDTVFGISKALKTQGAGSLVAAAAVNTIGGTGVTTLKGGRVALQAKNIRYEQTSGDVSVRGGTGTYIQSPNATIESSGTATFSGNTATFSSSDGGRGLQMSGTTVYGFGNLGWNQNGTTDRPVLYKTVSYTVGGGSRGAYVALSTWISQSYLDRYRWFVAGWYTGSRRPAASVRVVNNNSSLLVWKHIDNVSQSYTFEVVLVGFAKDWCQGL